MTPDQAVSTVGGALTSFTLNISLTLIIKVLFTIVACLIAVKVITNILGRMLNKSRLEQTLSNFIGSILKVVLYFIAILIVLSTLGVDVTSLVALLSVAGLAVSLALQSTLSNLAGGIQLLVTKPFAAGNFVEAGANSGTVYQVGLAYTTLITPDNKVIHVPNSDIAAARIVNYNGRDTRRVDIQVTASYEAPIQLVKDTAAKLVAADSRIHADPAPFVRVSNYGSSSIEYTIRVWCAAADYWDVYFDLMDGLKPAFDAAGVEMTYDHLNVHVVEK
ncbi:MAG: mechanosensitive ion channel [Oscillospiraceae bacterium]|nr:mechanosensitive ion channel [Oscillospiraceae bacterium]